MTSTSISKINLPRRNFNKDESNSSFIKKAIVSSLVFHLTLFFIKFPNDVIKVQVKEKISSIKMNFIKPSESSRMKKKEFLAKEALAKIITTVQAGAKTVSSSAKINSGNPDQNKVQQIQKSKAGSPKNGPASSPSSQTNTIGDSSAKSYQFKGKGLNALVGNSSTMTISSATKNDGSRELVAGVGLANKGSNLSGDYRAPAGMGDGSGHMLGKDMVGNYDKSTSTKGIANKKGIDTAFVQPDTVILGSIDPEVLRKILGEYLGQFKFCYQQELQENSEKIKGIVDLNFRIEGDGKVSRVIIKSSQTKFSERGVGCMSNILKMIDFPKPKGGGLVDVRQPLNFFSENTKI